MYILKGQKAYPEFDVLKWGQWMEEAHKKGSRIVAKTEIVDIRVSTVFLGIDHAFNPDKPILFKTMVFGSKKYEDFQQIYHTWDEAKKGHEQILQAIRKDLTTIPDDYMSMSVGE